MRVPDYLLRPCLQPVPLTPGAPDTVLRVITTNNHRAAECRMLHDALRNTLLNRRANRVQ